MKRFKSQQMFLQLTQKMIGSIILSKQVSYAPLGTTQQKLGCCISTLMQFLNFLQGHLHVEHVIKVILGGNQHMDNRLLQKQTWLTNHMLLEADCVASEKGLEKKRLNNQLKFNGIIILTPCATIIYYPVKIQCNLMFNISTSPLLLFLFSF